ncbi:MAG: glycosyltransferase [Omnitrophica bacterium]|nr:glycosyltransferase [Candidatus Omnitrophota bacterium]
MADFKRHYLAQNIRSLALIDNGYREGNDECFKKTKKLLKNATWLNQINKKYTFLASSEVAKFYNQAKVGLCLSKEEGAMYASMEYLLCGLPIVSTQSIGGRDIFFDEEYVKIVNDTADDVARGVQELIDLNIDSQYIRENTLKKIQTHREKFITKVQDIYDKENVNKDFRENFNNIFIDKMLRNEKIKNIKNYTIEKIGSSIESRK